MKYVLIYFVFAPVFGGASISQEFDDAESCHLVVEMLDRSFSATRDHEAAFDMLTVSTCVPKGSAK